MPGFMHASTKKPVSPIYPEDDDEDDGDDCLPEFD
jgi:hypothetical protein